MHYISDRKQEIKLLCLMEIKENWPDPVETI